MESDIIVEGFKEVEIKYGLWYMCIVGDGDLFVYVKIREEVFEWGRDVQKEECVNYVCKCYRFNFEKFVMNNFFYKGRYNFIKKVRVQLVFVVRCVICVRVKQRENKEFIILVVVVYFKYDILNFVYYVFGNYLNCLDFCKVLILILIVDNL